MTVCCFIPRSFSLGEGAEAIASADSEFTVLRNLLKDSDKVKVVAGATILSKLATRGKTLSPLSLKTILIAQQIPLGLQPWGRVSSNR